MNRSIALALAVGTAVGAGATVAPDLLAAPVAIEKTVSGEPLPVGATPELQALALKLWGTSDLRYVDTLDVYKDPEGQWRFSGRGVEVVPEVPADRKVTTVGDVDASGNVAPRPAKGPKR